MQDFSLGAGLAALAFWGFIASVVVAGIWYDIRKREAQQETIRRLVESGQSIDEELMDKLLLMGAGKSDRLDRSLKISGLIMIPVAVGMAIFGKVLGSLNSEAEIALLGVSALIGCIGLGLLGAAYVASRWYSADDPASVNEV